MSKENFAVNPLRQSPTGKIDGHLKVNKELQRVAIKLVDIWNRNSDQISAGQRLKELYLKHK
jgi:hypothetical protein